MAMMTYPLNYTDYDYEDAETWLATRNSGVFVKNDFAYSVTGTDTSITFGEGLAWIHNHRFAGKVFKNDSNFILNFGVSDPNYDRIDVAVIQFDKVKNATEIVVKNGVAQTNPIIPAISQTEELYELYICSVYREAGSPYITDKDVTDLRLSPEYCGLMADNVTSIDTAAIYSQVMALINRLENEIAGIENGTEMMLKSVYDTNGDGTVDNAKKLNGHTVDYFMPKSGGQFTGNVALAAGNDIVYEYEGEQYPLMDMIGGLADTVFSEFMPKRGGYFEGTVYQHQEDASGSCLRGSNVLDDAWQPFSTCDIAFIRK